MWAGSAGGRAGGREGGGEGPTSDVRGRGRAGAGEGVRTVRHAGRRAALRSFSTKALKAREKIETLCVSSPGQGYLL